MTTTLTRHLAGHDLDPALPLALQAKSLEAELAACQVFQAAAHRDLDRGDLRAMARLAALDTHEQQLRAALADIALTH